jgi:ubiquinone biosynthesis protein Coq4
MTWRQTLALLRASRAGTPLGDIAVMKFDMLWTAPPGLNERLRALGNAALEIDMNALRALPDGTVGRTYARHLDDNGLKPLVISPAMKERYADKPYALRSTSTHDLFHVLTGFATTPAGETGLYAFMLAQGFAGASRKRLLASAAIYSVLAPLHTRGIVHNIRVGSAMGKKAKPLIEQPLETFLAEPLDAVRERLGLPDPVSAGIAPGRDSALFKWIFNWLVPKERPNPAAAAPLGAT